VSTISVQLLARHGLFSELSPGDLDELAASLRGRRCGKGQIIFAEGDPGNSLYLIESGRVNVSLSTPDGKEVLLNSLGPGDLLGELALLDGEPRSADAIVQEDARLLVLQRDDFVRFVETHPKVGLKLLAAVSRKLRRTTQQVQDVALLDVPARLARALLDLAATRGEPVGRTRARTIQITQSDLAATIGATRESANKWLGHFERKGILRLDRGQVTVLDLEALRKRIY
jgi:CRP-like cAMP-binding protein